MHLCKFLCLQNETDSRKNPEFPDEAACMFSFVSDAKRRVLLPDCAETPAHYRQKKAEKLPAGARQTAGFLNKRLYLFIDTVCVKSIFLQKFQSRTRLTESIVDTDLHHLCRRLL